MWVSTALDNERPKGPGAIMEARGYRGWRAIGRLKPGVTIEQAQSEADVIAASLAAQFPDENKDMGIGVRPLLESMVGNLRPDAAAPVGRRRVRAADRLRERRQPAARTRHQPAA